MTRKVALFGVAASFLAGCSMVSHQAHALALVAMLAANGFAVLSNNWRLRLFR